MRRSLFCVGMVLLAVAGCTDVRPDTLVTIQADTAYFSDSLGIPVRVAYGSNVLTVIDMAVDHPIHLIDARSGRLLGSALGWGAGPGELRSPWRVFATGDRSCVWDPGLVRLVCLRRTPGAAVDSFDIVLDAVVWRGGELLMDVRLLSDSTMVAVGPFSQGLLMTANLRTGLPDHFVGEARQVPPGEPGHRILASVGDLEQHPDGDKFVLSQRYGGRLAVVNLAGYVVWADTPDPFEPVQARDSVRQTQPAAQARWGYVNIAVNRDAIYALFSGKVEVASPEEGIYSSEVHVFSWDGRLRARFQLDTPAVGLTVSPEHEVFAIAHSPAPSIRRYPLARVMRPLLH